MDAEIARAHLIGRQLWTPDVEFDRHSFEFVHPLCRLMLTAGMALGETASDADALLAAVEKGMAEAKAEHGQEIETHGERAKCDPDGKYPMCEYCQAYARSMSSSVESRRRWAEETKDSDRQFVVTAATWRKYSGEGKIHERGCPAVTREVNHADRLVETLRPYEAKHGGLLAEWPYLLNRLDAEAQNRHRCRVCSPDLLDRVSAGAVRAANGRFGGDET